MERTPPKRERWPAYRMAISACFAAAGIFIMVGLASAAKIPLAAVPFATSIVLVAGAPSSAPASTRAILLGHVICAIVGLCVLKGVGRSDLAMALAVGASVAAMLLANAFHPPAGITPLVVMSVTPEPGWDFLFIPVLTGAFAVIALARAAELALMARADPPPP